MKSDSLKTSGGLIAGLSGLAVITFALVALHFTSYSPYAPEVPGAYGPDREPPLHERQEPGEYERERGQVAGPPVMHARFQELYERNNHIVGWIRVPNTTINYPVVHCSDNFFYLHHNFDGRPSAAGTIFLDMDAGILENNQSMTLYGHYMGNDTKFSALHNYKYLEHYKRFPIFQFDTLYEDGFFKIFAVFYMAGNSSDALFYYFPFSTFSTDTAFMLHVNQIRIRSIFNTTVDVAPGDQLVLLTTCTYETYNLRLVVAGRRMRPGESFAFCTNYATLNPQPLFPQVWYDTKGGSPPQFDLYTITGGMLRN